jgi:hypothetical protein
LAAFRISSESHRRIGADERCSMVHVPKYGPGAIRSIRTCHGRRSRYHLRPRRRSQRVKRSIQGRSISDTHAGHWSVHLSMFRVKLDHLVSLGMMPAMTLIAKMRFGFRGLIEPELNFSSTFSGLALIVQSRSSIRPIRNPSVRSTPQMSASYTTAARQSVKPRRLAGAYRHRPRWTTWPWRRELPRPSFNRPCRLVHSLSLPPSRRGACRDLSRSPWTLTCLSHLCLHLQLRPRDLPPMGRPNVQNGMAMKTSAEPCHRCPTVQAVRCNLYIPGSCLHQMAPLRHLRLPVMASIHPF